MADDFKKLVIVYVEDDAAVRGKVSRALQRRVEKLYTGENGKEGLELIRRYDPDIVITDLEMPVMNGMEMIAQIRDKNPEMCDMPIIVVTAYKDQEHFTEFANIYVYKPLDILGLIQSIEELVIECGIVGKRSN